MSTKVLFVLGTRPEAIKFAPLIQKMKEKDGFQPIVCFTGQHKEMLYHTADFFSIQADFDLSLMVHNQSLTQFLSNALVELENIIKKVMPDLVFVQGDTSTVLAGSLAAYYSKTKLAHLEAGLRSHDKYSPFPEEINRSLTSRIADFHFAPTENARANLLREGINKDIYVVGNTVIDALFLCLEKIRSAGEDKYYQTFNQIDFNKKIILLTCHRRESFGDPLLEILSAIKLFAHQYPDVQIIYPVHLNPNIQNVVLKELAEIPNIHLMAPLDYPALVWIMSKSFFVVTDSGGIQEEAPALGKPVLVLRENTERIESIEAGTSVLVGHDQEKILTHMVRLYTDDAYYHSFKITGNPYGDGTSSKQIIDILTTALKIKY
ncbi:MAG: UDP-N-acetylglucosamine 2-epimerase (non-hydrolyzing) [Saprospiraceae bacterium]